MKADLAVFYDSAVKPVSMPHNYRWLPPRVDGLPRGDSLWVYSAGLAATTGVIPPDKASHPPRRAAKGK